MLKTTLLVCAALVILVLFLRRPATSSGGVVPIRDYFGAPPPGPNYATSPPTSAHSTVSDAIAIANTVGSIGFGIFDRISSGASSSSGGLGGLLSDNSSSGGGLNLTSYV
jgi:uncharacterized membrane protein YgcG